MNIGAGHWQINSPVGKTAIIRPGHTLSDLASYFNATKTRERAKHSAIIFAKTSFFIGTPSNDVGAGLELTVCYVSVGFPFSRS
jgi:hypothetical protein